MIDLELARYYDFLYAYMKAVVLKSIKKSNIIKPRFRPEKEYHQHGR